MDYIKKALPFVSLIGLILVLETKAQQQVFERRITTANNVGLAVTNVGTIGKSDVRNDPGGDPSFEYPRDSGTEHLFEAGIWIGGFRNGSDLLVSTASVTNPSGFSPGTPGFEFTNDGTLIEERSSLTDSELFSPVAISHQDFIARYSDSRTAIQTGSGTIPIRGHDQPLFVDVNHETYSWNFGFTEAFSIMRLDLTNQSDFTYDSVHVGMYADIVVRNVNNTLESGSAFFNKNGIGYLDSLFTSYAFDAGSNDSPSINTYGGMSLIGAEYRDLFFHPSNPDSQRIKDAGFSVPKVGPSYWLFSAGTGVFRGPAGDQDRFERMALAFPIDEPTVATNDDPEFTNRELLRTAGRTANGNFISLIKMGPFPKWDPGETITVFFAFTGALFPSETINISPNTQISDTPENRINLEENLGWVFRTFSGEDRNRNGVLDAGEDVNQNNRLDRFLIPEPPESPRLRVELESGKAILLWDRRAESSVDPVSGQQDFEGYRVYRSELGADLRGTISSNAQLIAQWDSPGNTEGFNNGFQAIELDEPISIDGIDYWYRFEVDNLLSGWQYLFSVTAFDAGGEEVDVPSLESSVNANAVRVFPGTPTNAEFGSDETKVGVYPNPYRINAAWDGGTSFTRKIVFYNLPSRAEIIVYTLAGDIVAEIDHESVNNNGGDTRWFDQFSSSNRLIAGGEHAWDVLSESRQNLSSGLYIYTVKDLDRGDIQRGKLVIIK